MSSGLRTCLRQALLSAVHTGAPSRSPLTYWFVRAVVLLEFRGLLRVGFESMSEYSWEFPKIGVPYFGILIIRILLSSQLAILQAYLLVTQAPTLPVNAKSPVSRRLRKPRQEAMPAEELPKLYQNNPTSSRFRVLVTFWVPCKNESLHVSVKGTDFFFEGGCGSGKPLLGWLWREQICKLLARVAREM